jgi:hypothetical protein
MLLDIVLLATGAVIVALAGSRLVDFAAAIAEKARLNGWRARRSAQRSERSSRK